MRRSRDSPSERGGWEERKVGTWDGARTWGFDAPHDCWKSRPMDDVGLLLWGPPNEYMKCPPDGFTPD
jgi:hypothetical protein